MIGRPALLDWEAAMMGYASSRSVGVPDELGRYLDRVANAADTADYQRLAVDILCLPAHSPMGCVLGAAWCAKWLDFSDEWRDLAQGEAGGWASYLGLRERARRAFGPLLPLPFPTFCNDGDVVIADLGALHGGNVDAVREFLEFIASPELDPHRGATLGLDHAAVRGFFLAAALSLSGGAVGAIASHAHATPSVRVRQSVAEVADAYEQLGVDVRVLRAAHDSYSFGLLDGDTTPHTIPLFTHMAVRERDLALPSDIEFQTDVGTLWHESAHAYVDLGVRGLLNDEANALVNELMTSGIAHFAPELRRLGASPDDAGELLSEAVAEYVGARIQRWHGQRVVLRRLLRDIDSGDVTPETVQERLDALSESARAVVQASGYTNGSAFTPDRAYPTVTLTVDLQRLTDRLCGLDGLDDALRELREQALRASQPKA